MFQAVTSADFSVTGMELLKGCLLSWSISIIRDVETQIHLLHHSAESDTVSVTAVCVWCAHGIQMGQPGAWLILIHAYI